MDGVKYTCFFKHCLIYLNDLFKDEDENWYFRVSLGVRAFRQFRADTSFC